MFVSSCGWVLRKSLLPPFYLLLMTQKANEFASNRATAFGIWVLVDFIKAGSQYLTYIRFSSSGLEVDTAIIAACGPTISHKFIRRHVDPSSTATTSRDSDNSSQTLPVRYQDSPKESRSRSWFVELEHPGGAKGSSSWPDDECEFDKGLPNGELVEISSTTEDGFDNDGSSCFSNHEDPAAKTHTRVTSNGCPASFETPATHTRVASNGCPASMTHVSSSGCPASKTQVSSSGCPASETNVSSSGCPAAKAAAKREEEEKQIRLITNVSVKYTDNQ